MPNVLEAACHGREDYGWFMTRCLDVDPAFYWDGMKKIADSVRDNKNTAVGAGHGVSKTYGAARIALTFLYCYYPSTVITTAPSGDQVKNLMWREIREAHTNAKIRLGGKLGILQLDMQPSTGIRWYAIGISTKPDTVTREATRLQGIHNQHVLFIKDEAAAIMPEIWRAGRYIGAPFKRVLAIGNPTRKFGDFPEALRSPDWNHIQISVRETPNFIKSNNDIPGVYGREFEREVRLAYGKDSDEYRVRVDGGISEKGAEGSYYGAKMNQLREKGRISDDVEHNPNYPVYIIFDTGYTTAIGFVQLIDTWFNFISYYEDSGLGIEKYVQLFDEYEKERKYRYADIYVPCDMDSNATKVITGQTTLDTLKQFTYKTKKLKRESRVLEGIKRTNRFLDRCRFHKTRCARLIDCLEGYHEKKNKMMSTEDKPVFTGEPDKDGTDHGADMARYVSMAAKLMGSGSMTAAEAKEIWARRTR